MQGGLDLADHRAEGVRTHLIRGKSQQHAGGRVHHGEAGLQAAGPHRVLPVRAQQADGEVLAQVWLGVLPGLRRDVRGQIGETSFDCSTTQTRRASGRPHHLQNQGWKRLTVLLFSVIAEIKVRRELR